MLSDFLSFVRLARKRFNSNADYIEFQRFQARHIVSNLRREGIILNGKKILDLGCGSGGYSIELEKIGGKVFSLDLNAKMAADIKRNFTLICGDATAIPFRNELFDIVFCSSLIEHIEKKDRLLFEINRVLSKDGIFYLSFPPFFSPFGGHHYSPFHCLGERVALSYGRLRYRNFKFSSFREYGLFPITIREAKKLISNYFTIELIKTRFMPINTAVIPLIGEFITWHVEFILKKRR